MKPTDTTKWTREDLEEIAKHTPLSFDFQGLSPSDENYLKFSMGGSHHPDRFGENVEMLVETFEDTIEIEDVEVEAGYAGAYNDVAIIVRILME